MGLAQAVEHKLRKKKLPKGEHMIGSDHGEHEMAPMSTAAGAQESPDPTAASRKERFHRIMAEHYASGGEVDADMVKFGNKQDFLSSEGQDGVQPKELAQEHEPEVESLSEDAGLKKRMRLRKVLHSIHKK